MKLLDISDIAELTRSNVHIGNKPLLIEKINKLISGGHKKLQIVTDFDHTLTRHKMDDGSVVLTSFGMFRECPSIPQYYKDEDTRLSGIYKPIEADPHMKVEEKIKHMVNWYHAAHDILKGVKLPRDELIESGNKMRNCFRLGVKDMLAWSSERGVPVLVFSAGLGESVVAALQASQLLLPNVKVVSNFLSTDENDAIIGIKGEVIHTYNKNEAAIKGTEYYELVKERDNVVLMGDNIGDAGMAEGMDHCDTVIKVGFLGHGTDNLPNYLKHFDVVLVDEHSVDLVNAILKHLL
ncbi:7-methylguanosine phosphate-specific 5'-nucleotidase [Leguminivora glycinivorella]|uniref:7-methylguanosine phosphate-specific 5'-nucleotidase n=1 Tax=Leguminivora glycinivorella TaxID=1035111 RepID=UPI00200BFA67|nr:7-methylguanosine phosphate-specific 5'-nucleotidase [Leguminivora glycinivorella]XP_047989925.1 7-methylguanosine phosphate-specific 5'-nucleotidase [Leguminivora glycinivorella]XP_047989926.1 7-methylguanosine phosphate-specific 5'-nucleotidase [Leguminivora glycinivorella]